MNIKRVDMDNLKQTLTCMHSSYPTFHVLHAVGDELQGQRRLPRSTSTQHGGHCGMARRQCEERGVVGRGASQCQQRAVHETQVGGEVGGGVVHAVTSTRDGVQTSSHMHGSCQQTTGGATVRRWRWRWRWRGQSRRGEHFARGEKEEKLFGRNGRCLCL